MNTSLRTDDLGKRIEKVVQEHIDASRQLAEAALKRAFSIAPLPRTTTTIPSTAHRPKQRSPKEVAELGNRFYQALCEKPGETTAVLASHMGVTSSELKTPMMKLKQARRIRSVGQRQFTRYFPMADETAETG